jgi:hypothetical protein
MIRDGLENEFTTAPLWVSAKPRRPWLIPVCTAAFIAALSALVVAHACMAVGDADVRVAEMAR